MAGSFRNPKAAILSLGVATGAAILTQLTDHSGTLGLLLIGSFVVVDVTVIAIVLAERRMGGRGQVGGRGLDGDGGPVPEVPGAVWRWRVLGAVARLMPPTAGRRWRGEAESALFEMDPGKRAAAVRSYLRSAPRVLVVTWARELSGRVRRRTG